MLAALRAFDDAWVFTVETLDVDADPRLVAQYDELVPVLLGRKDAGEPVQLCQYLLDPSKVRTFLENA